MKAIRSPFLCILALLFTFLPGVNAEIDEQAFNAILNSVERKNLQKLESGGVHSALTGASNAKAEKACPSALRLWISDRRPELELAWIRQDDRNARLAILAIFYTQIEDTDTSTFPPFKRYIEKFTAPEQAERLEEWNWILKNKTKIKDRISALVR